MQMTDVMSVESVDTMHMTAVDLVGLEDLEERGLTLDLAPVPAPMTVAAATAAAEAGAEAGAEAEAIPGLLSEITGRGAPADDAAQQAAVARTRAVARCHAAAREGDAALGAEAVLVGMTTRRRGGSQAVGEGDRTGPLNYLQQPPRL